MERAKNISSEIGLRYESRYEHLSKALMISTQHIPRISHPGGANARLTSTWLWRSVVCFCTHGRSVRPWEIFDTPTEEEIGRYLKLIIVDTGGKKAGIIVKRILGQQEIVIKGLPSIIRGISGISGATILGSGKVAFIWDPHVIFEERCAYVSDKETFVHAN